MSLWAFIQWAIRIRMMGTDTRFRMGCYKDLFCHCQQIHVPFALKQCCCTFQADFGNQESSSRIVKMPIARPKVPAQDKSIQSRLWQFPQNSFYCSHLFPHLVNLTAKLPSIKIPIVLHCINIFHVC